MAFWIVRDEILKVNADAVVEAVSQPDAPEGEAVFVKAEGKTQKRMSAMAKYRIGLYVPLWKDGESGEPEKLREGYRKVLEAAVKKRCRSIVFPLIAGGTYNIPKNVGFRIATEVFLEFLKEREMDITLAVPGDYGDKVSADLFRDVDSYVDDKRGMEEFECCDDWDMQPSMPQPMAQPSPQQPFLAQPMPQSVARPAARRARKVATGSGYRRREDSSASLEERLKSMYTDSFEKHLQQLINKKGMKNSEVYAAANISKQYFSKLMKGQVRPSKEKVLALAVGLRLNLDETVDFLRLAGYALSPVSQTDVVVEYFISRQDYNVMKIDIVLFDYGLPPLSDPRATAG